MTKLQLSPIGKVKSSFKKPVDTIVCCEKGLKVNNLSQIIVNKKYQKGLKGLTKFSHLFIIYSLHQTNKTEITTYPGPLTIKNLPQVGVFAARNQYRPNHLALRLVKLIKVDKNIITVKGLDAINNSPVIDIKPYVSGFDRPEKVKDAPWYQWFTK